MNEKLTIAQQKKQLRQKLIQQRQQLTETKWQQKSKLICQHLLASELVQNSRVILGYCSYKQEPDLSYLYQHHQCIWGLPRCQGKNLIWHQWQLEDKLISGKYGIKEPSTNSSPIDLSQVDLILVPAVSCDRSFYRLGYGGGYYDRILASPQFKQIPTIGIIFHFAYLAKLIIEEWDQPLKYICTEEGLLFS